MNPSNFKGISKEDRHRMAEQSFRNYELYKQRDPDVAFLYERNMWWHLLLGEAEAGL